ncbi:MAG: insulinase family protein [Cytophagales bacterium]|nr:MAG: insulinase family protein [Cytophagales bacterium]
MTKTEYSIHTFENGIKWVHKQVKNTKIAHCGIMLDIGSRDELAHQQGIAHFWEHMAFKGTTTKSANYILNRIDNLGGELNAYTTKEKICFHASLLDKHFEKAIELLTDITFNSTFPEKEIEKERMVILEEMKMYADDPEDAIQDEFEQVIFGDSSMGNNILGTVKSVSKFSQKDFKEFIASNLDTSRLVVSTVGSFSDKSKLKIMDKYLNKITRISTNRTRNYSFKSAVNQVSKPKKIHQAHCMLGKQSYALESEKRLVFFMLTNMIGGQAMNSKLNVALREKHGLVYTVDAQFSPYLGTGIFNIYFGCEKNNIQKSKNIIFEELNKLTDTLLSDKALKVIKNQLKGQLAMSEENNNGMMMLLAKNILDFGFVESLDSIFSKIDLVQTSDLQAIAKEMFVNSTFSSLTYLPE